MRMKKMAKLNRAKAQVTKARKKGFTGKKMMSLRPNQVKRDI